MTTPVIEYTGTYDFALSPEALWEAIERFESFGTWWGWLHEFHLEGDGLAAGSVLHGLVVPPLPYRMRVRVDLLDCVRPSAIDAAVHGDLEGVARMRARAGCRGTTVEIGWTVEMMQRPMRIASRFAYPLLRWGHDRVIEMTLRGLPPEFGYKGPAEADRS